MNKCEQCRFYTAYYIKGTYSFINSLCGKCRKQHKLVSRGKRCEHFKEKPAPNRNIDFALDRLNEVLDDIMALKQILEDKLKKPSD